MLTHFSDEALPVERFIGLVTKCTVSIETLEGINGLVDAFVSTIGLEEKWCVVGDLT